MWPLSCRRFAVEHRCMNEATKQTCVECGYASTTTSFFQRDRFGPFSRLVCMGCGPHQPTKQQLFRLEIFLTACALLIIGTAATFLPSPRFAGYGYLLTLFGIGGVMTPLTTTVHEAGHWFFARSVRHQVFRVVIGSGPIVWRWGSAPIVEFRRYCFGGGHIIDLPREEKVSKWRR